MSELNDHAEARNTETTLPELLLSPGEQYSAQEVAEICGHKILQLMRENKELKDRIEQSGR